MIQSYGWNFIIKNQIFQNLFCFRKFLEKNQTREILQHKFRENIIYIYVLFSVYMINFVFALKYGIKIITKFAYAA
jgi:hypothetical protein